MVCLSVVLCDSKPCVKYDGMNQAMKLNGPSSRARVQSNSRSIGPTLTLAVLAFVDGNRWLLLSFKREFSFQDAVRLFEILCSHHLEVTRFVFIYPNRARVCVCVCVCVCTVWSDG